MGAPQGLLAGRCARRPATVSLRQWPVITSVDGLRHVQHGLVRVDGGVGEADAAEDAAGQDDAQFIARHQPVLERTAGALFSVNIVARKPEKNRPDTNPYLRKFLGQIAWKPTYLAVFAGKLDYPRYRPFDRFMIRLIMWMTKGPTDPNAVIEFTDWQQVEAFGRQVCEQV